MQTIENMDNLAVETARLFRMIQNSLQETL